MSYIMIRKKNMKNRRIPLLYAINHRLYPEYESLRQEMEIDVHAQRALTDPNYYDQYTIILEKFQEECNKRKIWPFGVIPQKTSQKIRNSQASQIERNLYKKNIEFITIPDAEFVRCMFCEEIFISKKFSNKRYCSPSCKRKSNNEVRNEKKAKKLNKPIITYKICQNPGCGKSLTNKRAGTIFCSSACCVAMWRKKKES